LIIQHKVLLINLLLQ